MIKNGYITGKLPTSPNNKQIIKNVHDNIAYPGLNNALLIKKPLQKNGNNNKQAIAHAIKNIPNNLFVTDRKMAYNGKKYHSGTIWAGVTNELAKIKLSEWPSLSGANITNKKKATNNKIILNPSFNP